LAVAPAHLISTPIDSLRNLIAASPAFRSWVGAGDEAAAKARIHYWAERDPATLAHPYVVAGLPESPTRITMTAAGAYSQSGTIAAVAIDERDQTATLADQMMRMANDWGEIVREMLTGGLSEMYPAAIEIDAPDFVEDVVDVAGTEEAKYLVVVPMRVLYEDSPI